MPKAIFEVGKELGQGIARSVATVGMTAGNIPAQLAGQPAPFDKEMPSTGNKFTEAIFGGKPIM